jgi:branched-chain amino acid transport system substrate-binding protein
VVKSYEVLDPTVDTQIIALQASGADTFINVGAAKFAAQAIRKSYDIGWRPVQYLFYGSGNALLSREKAPICEGSSDDKNFL